MVTLVDSSNPGLWIVVAIVLGTVLVLSFVGLLMKLAWSRAGAMPTPSGINHARAHGMRRLHRIVLSLDESNHKVRATDFATSFDWSAGGSGAVLNWKFVTGVVLFQYEHQSDEQGHFTLALSYSYIFNLQEMKCR